jgi:cystathionine gamma-synthase
MMRKPGPSTRALHGVPQPGGAISTPIVHSATFSFDTLAELIAQRDRHADGAYYQREGHPTLRGCERRLAALEGAEEALLFASGMAAITGIFLAHVKTGERVVALRQCYGGTLEALRWGSEHLGWVSELVDAREPAGFEAALARRPKLVHIESPTNPTLCVTDIARLAELAHRHGALLSVDNTVASPLGQRPLLLGADLVVHSATKSLGGHSDLLSGVVMGSAQALAPLWKVRTTFGGIADPTSAWLIERSVKTLALRVERANANALELARRLERDPRVLHVNYPGLERHPGHDVAARQMELGFGPLLSFEVPNGAAGAETAVQSFGLIRHAPSLGGVDTLVVLPLHTSHVRLTPEQRAEAGIPDGLVRLSVGVEDVEDLWADLDHALARTVVATAAR